MERVVPAAIVLLDDSVIAGRRRWANYWIMRRAFAPGSPGKTLPGQSDPPGLLQGERAGLGFGPGSHADPASACSRAGWTDLQSSKDAAIGLIKNWS